MIPRHKLPALGDGEVGAMVMLMSHNDCQPLFDRVPKTDYVATIDKKVVNGLRTLLAKQAKTAIWPTTFCQAIGRPNPILVHKPCTSTPIFNHPSLSELPILMENQTNLWTFRTSLCAFSGYISRLTYKVPFHDEKKINHAFGHTEQENTSNTSICITVEYIDNRNIWTWTWTC